MIIQNSVLLELRHLQTRQLISLYRTPYLRGTGWRFIEICVKGEYIMEAITGALTSVLGFAGTVLDTILANPTLALFFALGLTGSIIGVVHQLKNV